MAEYTNYLFFNSGIEVDVIKVERNTSLTFQEAIDQKEHRDLITTTLFNTFDKNTMANYVPPNPMSALATITIYRKTPDQKYLEFVCFLPEGAVSFYDYNIKNNIYYHYVAAIPVPVRGSNGQMSMEYKMYENKNILTDQLIYHHAYWKTWSLTNIVESSTVENTYEQTGYTWNLMLNIDSENVTKNTSVTSWDTLGRYPKLSIGKKNYDSATFEGLLGVVAEYDRITEVTDNNMNVTDVSNNVFAYTERFVYQMKIYVKDEETNTTYPKLVYVDTRTGKELDMTNPEDYSLVKYATEMQKLEKWKEFVNDGNLKLLKDLKGNSWIVQIMENPVYDIDNKPHSAPTKISFTWQEVENVDNTAIVNFTDNDTVLSV